MTQQRILQFEYQQSLVQESERPGWSEEISVSVRILSEALTSGWYRERFGSRGNDFVILLAIAMHARPLKGDDLQLLVRLGMATPDDEGRLYARVSDMALAEELGMSRMTIARATERLAAEASISILAIPEELTAFRDSRGRFCGSKVFLIAGNVQKQFLEKNIENTHRATKSSTVNATYVETAHRATKSGTASEESAYRGTKSSTVDGGSQHRATKSGTVDGQNGAYRATKSSTPCSNLCTNIEDEEEEEEEEESATLAEEIFACFAECKNDDNYHPSAKEQLALDKLLADGFTREQIVAGIEEAFARPSRPRHFTHCAAIARDLARYRQEPPPPETRQPGSQDAAALPEPVSPADEPPLVIDAFLARAVGVYESAGRQVTLDLLARFGLMAGRCEAAARAAGSSGADWLADALAAALGVAKPASLLNYADAVLNDWIAHGRSVPAEKPSRRPKTDRHKGESGVHQGIRDYIKKRGGIPDDE